MIPIKPYRMQIERVPRHIHRKSWQWTCLGGEYGQAVLTCAGDRCWSWQAAMNEAAEHAAARHGVTL